MCIKLIKNYINNLLKSLSLSVCILNYINFVIYKGYTYKINHVRCF